MEGELDTLSLSILTKLANYFYVMGAQVSIIYHDLEFLEIVFV